MNPKRIITYSLRESAGNSDDFYLTAARLADEVLEESKSYINGSILCELIDYANSEGHKRCKEESVLEILAMGIFLRLYGAYANLKPLAERAMLGLNSIRKHSGKAKPLLDRIRGFVSTAFLSKQKRGEVPRTSLNLLSSVLSWMRATGDYHYEVQRLQLWCDYLSHNESRFVDTVLESSLAFADWFRTRAREVLGKYTPNVVNYLNTEWATHRFREDYLFCGRKEVEYHLNMVGAEILSRCYSDEFFSAASKEVIVPACLRSQSSGCRATKGSHGLKCVGCTPSCRVHHLSELGRENDFEVYVLPHESDFPSVAEDNQIGVVGIACVNHLIAGGWKARELNMPPLCVLLDYCGCSNHWDKEGFPTDLNISQLKKVLRIEDDLKRTVTS